MQKRKPKKFDVVGTGYVPCNKHRWKDARLVLFRPGWGIVSVSFSNRYIGHGGALRIEDKTVDSTVVVSECHCDKISDFGADMSGGRSWNGICFMANGVFELGFSFKDYPSGDIRDMVDMALRRIGWPVEPKKYFLVGKSGEFWDRPFPFEDGPYDGLSDNGKATPERLKNARDTFGERVNAIEAKVS